MKRILSLCCAAVALIAAITIPIQLSEATEPAPVSDIAVHEPVSSVPVAASSKAQPELAGYIVREYEDMIGVFVDDSDNPVQVYEVDVNSLPDLDRELLAQGMYAFDDAALQRLLEDYTG